jgi:hypothetical protein
MKGIKTMAGARKEIIRAYLELPNGEPMDLTILSQKQMEEAIKQNPNARRAPRLIALHSDGYVILYPHPDMEYKIVYWIGNKYMMTTIPQELMNIEIDRFKKAEAIKDGK